MRVQQQLPWKNVSQTFKHCPIEAMLNLSWNIHSFIVARLSSNCRHGYQPMSTGVGSICMPYALRKAINFGVIPHSHSLIQIPN